MIGKYVLPENLKTGLMNGQLRKPPTAKTEDATDCDLNLVTNVHEGTSVLHDLRGNLHQKQLTNPRGHHGFDAYLGEFLLRDRAGACGGAGIMQAMVNCRQKKDATSPFTKF